MIGLQPILIIENGLNSGMRTSRSHQQPDRLIVQPDASQLCQQGGECRGFVAEQ